MIDKILGLIIFLCSMCQNRRVGIIFCFVLIIGGLFDSGLKGLGWYQYVQNINVVSYANQYWSGKESILGQSIYMKGTVIVFLSVSKIILIVCFLLFSCAFCTIYGTNYIFSYTYCQYYS